MQSLTGMERQQTGGEESLQSWGRPFRGMENTVFNFRDIKFEAPRIYPGRAVLQILQYVVEILLSETSELACCQLLA